MCSLPCYPCLPSCSPMCRWASWRPGLSDGR
jgi:hypothetical protein